MHKIKKNTRWLIAATLTIVLLSLFTSRESLAASVVGAKTDDELVRYLESNEELEIVLENNLSLNQNVTVSSPKILNLNTKTLTAATGTNARAGRITLKRFVGEFTVKNGVITGGYSSGAANGGIIYSDRPAALRDQPTGMTVIVEDINYTGVDFVNTMMDDILIRGKVDVSTTNHNLRARNITFYGNPANEGDPQNAVYTGESTTNSYGDESGDNASANPIVMGWSSGGVALNGKKKVFKVEKNAKASVYNRGTVTYAYNNAVSHYTHVIVDGEFNAEANGPALRTTVSRAASNISENNGRSLISVNTGGIFRVSSTGSSGSLGVVYSYPLILDVTNPEIFDLRYFGRGRFLYAYGAGSNQSDVKFNNTSVATWNDTSMGIGNPQQIWQDLRNLSVLGFTNGALGTVSSNNPDAQANFKINNYSRISNDIALPVVKPELEIKADTYQIGNSFTQVSGSSEYHNPDGSVERPQVKNGTVKLTLGTGASAYVVETTTDNNGDWTIPVSLSKLAGRTGTLRLTDQDQRFSDVKVVVNDDTPPTAQGKVIQTNLNSMTGIPTDPKQALASYEDETTAKARLKVTYETSAAERAEMVKELGFHTLKIAVEDEAGNKTTVDSTLIVKDNSMVVGKNSAIKANNLTMNAADYQQANEGERRAAVIENGEMQAWVFDDSSFTEVTTDSKLFKVDLTGIKGQNPTIAYPIGLSVWPEGVVDAKMTVTIKFIDKTPPTGTGVLQKIKVGDTGIIPNKPAKELVADLEDDTTAVADIKVDYLPENEQEQTYAELVAEVGYKLVKVKATDLAGNSAIIPVPVMIYQEPMVVGDQGSIQGSNFSLLLPSYPATEKELQALVLKEAQLKAWELPSGKAVDVATNNEIKIDVSKMKKVVGVYDVKVSYRDSYDIIKVDVYGGSVEFVKTPTDIDFGVRNISVLGKDYFPKTEVGVSVEDARGSTEAWQLSLHVSQDMTKNGSSNSADKLKGGLRFKDTYVDSTGKTVVLDEELNSQRKVIRDVKGTLQPATEEITWKDQGLYLRVEPGVAPQGSYSGEVVWTLSDTPENNN